MGAFAGASTTGAGLGAAIRGEDRLFNDVDVDGAVINDATVPRCCPGRLMSLVV
jgi:hypothetical protein